VTGKRRLRKTVRTLTAPRGASANPESVLDALAVRDAGPDPCSQRCGCSADTPRNAVAAPPRVGAVIAEDGSVALDQAASRALLDEHVLPHHPGEVLCPETG